MAYEKFSRFKKMKLSYPAITITKSGHFSINEKCTEQFIKNYGFTELFYDSENKKIGLMPTKEESENTYKFNRRKDTKYITLSGKTFLNYFEIPYKTKATYPVTWNQKEKLIELDLESEINFFITKPTNTKTPKSKSNNSKDLEV